MKTTETIAIQEFQHVHEIISTHRSRALQTVNNENLLSAWNVGAYVSERLKNSDWGSKTVTQLSEYLRSQDPTLKGYSRIAYPNFCIKKERFNGNTYSLYSHDGIPYYENMKLVGRIKIDEKSGEITDLE
jgi:hypothetical protein